MPGAKAKRKSLQRRFRFLSKGFGWLDHYRYPSSKQARTKEKRDFQKEATQDDELDNFFDSSDGLGEE